MRARWMVFLVAVIATRVAHAEPPPLTEADAVKLALDRAPLVDIVEGTVDAERGRAQTLRTYPNPEVSYSREQTFGAAGTAETYVSIMQVIDIGHRRALRGAAADARADALHLDGLATRLDLAAQVRDRFYDVVFRQRRVASHERWVAHVDEALAIVVKREARGDASAYDRKRLERERLVTANRVETERADLDGARIRLKTLTASDFELVSGELLPTDPPAPDALHRQSAGRPDIAATQKTITATEREQKAAGRWWVPELRLELGFKGISLDTGGRTDGFIAGVGIALPLWDRTTGAVTTAQGDARAARGKRALLDAQIAAQLDGLRAEAVRRRDIAIAFAKEAPSTDLIRMTSRGYEAGELGVIELLDAFRGSADDELLALDLEHAARRARIDLDRLTGATSP